MTIQEALKKIKESDCCSVSAADDLLGSAETLKEGLDINEHRWYSIATNYYKMDDGILGVRGVYQVFSEGMCDADCDEGIEAFEGEEYTTISYRPKQV